MPIFSYLETHFSLCLHGGSASLLVCMGLCLSPWSLCYHFTHGYYRIRGYGVSYLHITLTKMPVRSNCKEEGFIVCYGFLEQCSSMAGCLILEACGLACCILPADGTERPLGEAVGRLAKLQCLLSSDPVPSVKSYILKMPQPLQTTPPSNYQWADTYIRLTVKSWSCQRPW